MMMRLDEAEGMMRSTVSDVLRELGVDESGVAVVFSDRRTFRAVGCCQHVFWRKVKGDDTLERGVSFVIVFYRPRLLAYLDDPSALRMVAVEEAAHTVHPNHGPDFLAEMRRRGFSTGGVIRSSPSPDAVILVIDMAQELLRFVPCVDAVCKEFDDRASQKEAAPVIKRLIEEKMAEAA
jgi:hypothetical protein